LIREHRTLFLAGILAALALRLFFFVYFPAVTDDSRTYADIATNWLQHGIYGQTQGTEIVPTDTRLPGYPAFLAVIFFLFGAGNFRAVMLAQILIDLVTCLVIADVARRTASERAARIAFVLAALCPFLANYSVAALTETLEIFFTALALDCAIAALLQMRNPLTASNSATFQVRPSGAWTGHPATTIKLWAAAGAAIAACILLRPDGGILLAAAALYLAGRALTARARQSSWSILIAGTILGACALAPLVPWTIRNFRTLHHFQPLAPRYANESDETRPRGFNRWVSTWIVDYASVEEIYWNVPGAKIDPQKLPSRALEDANDSPNKASANKDSGNNNGGNKDNANEKDATLALIADYNEEQELTPELDARFDQLAASRVRAHPVRDYLVLPVLRVADMWMRPRTEILPVDPRWWEFNDDVKHSITAVAFGVLNLAYVGAALLAMVRSTSRAMSRQPGLHRIGQDFGQDLGLRHSGLLIGFVLLRSALLLTLENPEPRYTLECYPAVIVCAAAYIAQATERQRQTKSRF
jgi:hypothetical protein